MTPQYRRYHHHQHRRYHYHPGIQGHDNNRSVTGIRFVLRDFIPPLIHPSLHTSSIYILTHDASKSDKFMHPVNGRRSRDVLNPLPSQLISDFDDKVWQTKPRKQINKQTSSTLDANNSVKHPCTQPLMHIYFVIRCIKL